MSCPRPSLALTLGLVLACSSKDEAAPEQAPAATVVAPSTASAGKPAEAEASGHAPSPDEYGLPGIGSTREGIGLSGLGTIDSRRYHAGGPAPSGARGPKPPSVRLGATSVSGKLPPEIIQRIVRSGFGGFRGCYEKGLESSSTLAGSVRIQFVIQADGAVKDVTHGGDLASEPVKTCIAKIFSGFSFPKPGSGIVKVSDPIAVAPPVYTLGGKPLPDAASADLDKALKDAGCTDLKASELAGGKGATVYAVKKGAASFKITFTPASSATLLPKEEAERLAANASVHQDGAFVLAVEGEDKIAARSLLYELLK